MRRRDLRQIGIHPCWRLLPPGLHDDYRVWKTFDCDATDRLHKKGFIAPSHRSLDAGSYCGLDKKGAEAQHVIAPDKQGANPQQGGNREYNSSPTAYALA